MSGLTQTRANYDRQLRALREDITLLGSMVEKAIERSVKSLRDRSLEIAESVIEDDERIDDQAYALEERALLLIATQQPMAGDLRTIAGALFIIAELERMGDYAEGIAKITREAIKEAPIKPLIDIPRMAELASRMLHDALNAYINEDLEACRRIWHQDDDVDALYNQVYRELLICMFNDPHTIERATQLLWVAHNLERVGDRVTNICERVAFVITANPRALKSGAQ